MEILLFLQSIHVRENAKFILYNCELYFEKVQQFTPYSPYHQRNLNLARIAYHEWWLRREKKNKETKMSKMSKGEDKERRRKEEIKRIRIK